MAAEMLGERWNALVEELCLPHSEESTIGVEQLGKATLGEGRQIRVRNVGATSMVSVRAGQIEGDTARRKRKPSVYGVNSLTAASV
jgi:hypothetical protein